MVVYLDVYVTMSVLLLGIQTVPTQPQPPTSMAGGALTAASMLSAAGAGFPATHTLGGGGGLALQQQQNAAAAAAAHQAAAAQQVAAAPTMAGPAAPGQHSSNPAIDAALSQAYSGIAQYTGTSSTILLLLVVKHAVTPFCYCY